MSQPAWSEGPQSGAALGDACYGCHGIENQSRGAIPPLVGLTQQEFIDKLTAFRAGTVPTTVMKRIMTGYSDAQIAAMAAFFAGKQK